MPLYCQPKQAIGSDIFKPLMEIWETLHDNPVKFKNGILTVGKLHMVTPKKEGYETIKASYNNRPNGASLENLIRDTVGFSGSM